MSRRLRTEEQKAAQALLEEKEEEDKFKILKQKIFAPIIWKRMSIGVKIQDLKDNYFNDVLRIMKEEYINNDVLCRNAELSLDEDSVQSLMNRITYFLKDTHSIIAVDETKNEIAGFLIMRVIHKSDYGQVFGRQILNQGIALEKVLNIEKVLFRKVDIFEKFKCDSYLQLFFVCVRPQYRKKEIGFQMLKCTLDIGRSLKQKILVGMLDNHVLQNKAKKIGMEVLHEIYYVDYRGKDGEMIFDDPGPGNYTCALMAGFCPKEKIPEPPPPPPPKKPDEKEEKKPKVTRAEKRAAKAKALEKAGKT